jgi:hypothetical protein
MKNSITKLKTFAITLTAPVLISSSAFAATTTGGCLTEDSIYLRSKTDLTQSCKVSKELKLTSTERYYTQFSKNPFTVDYWQGQVIKPYSTVHTYYRYITNTCTKTVVSEGEFDVKNEQTISYDLENPNLNPGLKYSYELVPMTDLEAQVKFQKLMDDCNKPPVLPK